MDCPPGHKVTAVEKWSLVEVQPYILLILINSFQVEFHVTLPTENSKDKTFKVRKMASFSYRAMEVL